MKEFIEIPFGAKDSELGGWEYNIPEGYTASIENSKIIVKKEESEDEKIRKEIIDYLSTADDKELIPYESWIAWLEKQGEQKPTDDEMKILLQTEYEKGKADALQEQRKEWTAEDLLNRNQIADILQEYNRNDLIKWLEMQGEKGTNGNEREIPNSVWSEEDEYVYNEILKRVTEKKLYEHDLEYIYKWLKSLRPQNWTKEDKERYISCLQRLGTGNPEQPETINSKWFKEHVYHQTTWKPSDEQMAALSNINVTGYISYAGQGQELINLYNELKKLKA